MGIMKGTHCTLGTVFLTAAILSACGGGNSSSTTINSVGGGAPDDAVELSRIAFNPAADEPVLPLPSDFLFSGTMDGTLETPDETSARAAGIAIDLSNPGAALGAADGWSTQMPMQISVDLASGASLDTASVGPDSVLLVETNCGLGLRGCTSFSQVPYGPGGYVAVASETGTINLVPLVPLKPKTNYLVALTNDLLDSRGEALAPSVLYAEVTRDSAEVDIQNESLASLQDAINGYEQLVSAATGVSPDDMIFASSWTTVSAGDAILATAQTVTAAMSPRVQRIAPHPVFRTTADFSPLLAGVADVYRARVVLPYFLADSTDVQPRAALTERFRASCDNGVLLSQADPAQLAGLTPGANATLCRALGLADFGLDEERYVTRYNPVPETRTLKTLDVIMTVPNNLSGQAGPFPLVMYQHGIASSKETLMAFADALALAGYAGIAIDLPLHGSRGFDLDGDGTDEINASTVNVTHFMNFEHLLTGRDNLRQSFLDMLGLRMAIANGFTFSLGVDISERDFDRSRLDFVGMSLGAMTGTVAVSLASALGMPVDSAAMIVTGGGIVPLLFSSQRFGSLIERSVLEGAGLDTQSADPASAAAVLGQFAFAAQTIVDTADPNNFAAGLAAGVTPVYMSQVNGDAVVPNQSDFGGLMFGGTEPLRLLMGLEQRSFGDAPAADGFVRFTEGSHSSFLSPVASGAATTEMQTQVVTFLAADVVDVTDAGVVE